MNEPLAEPEDVIRDSPLAEPPARLNGCFVGIGTSCNGRFLGVATVGDEDISENSLQATERGRATDTALALLTVFRLERGSDFVHRAGVSCTHARGQSVTV